MENNKIDYNKILNTNAKQTNFGASLGCGLGQLRPSERDVPSVQVQRSVPDTQGLGSVNWKFRRPELPVQDDLRVSFVWLVFRTDLKVSTKMLLKSFILIIYVFYFKFSKL